MGGEGQKTNSPINLQRDVDVIPTLVQGQKTKFKRSLAGRGRVDHQT